MISPSYTTEPINAPPLPPPEAPPKPPTERNRLFHFHLKRSEKAKEQERMAFGLLWEALAIRKDAEKALDEMLKCS